MRRNGEVVTGNWKGGARHTLLCPAPPSNAAGNPKLVFSKLVFHNGTIDFAGAVVACDRAGGTSPFAYRITGYGGRTCLVCIWFMDNSILGPLGGMRTKIVVVIVCLIVFAPNFALCQQDDQQDLPSQSLAPSGFMLDELQDESIGPTQESDALPEPSNLKPYESQIKQTYSPIDFDSQEFFPNGSADLFPGLLPDSVVYEPVPAVLLASPIRRSLARAWRGSLSVSNFGAYNLKIGDARFQVGTSLGIEGNDNIFLRETNRQGDLILRPTLTLGSGIVLSGKSALQLTLGIGYQAYMQHSDQNTMTLSPGSQIAFNISTGDFLIQLHDRFSLEQNPVSQPGLNNVANAGTFTNDIGGIVTWDMNKLVLNFGYDHYISLSTQSTASYPNQTGDSITLSAAGTVNAGLKTGLESEVDVTSYSQNTSFQFQNSKQVRLGPFVQWRLGPSASLQVDGGYDGFFVDHGGGSSAVSSRPLDWYGDLAFTQSLNTRISHSLSVGRQISGGLTSSLERIDYLRHAVAWNVVDRVGVGTIVYLEKADEGGGVNPEKSTRVGTGVTLSWRLGSKITVSSQYQFIYKHSDVPGLGYTQNELLLNFNYQF